MKLKGSIAVFAVAAAFAGSVAAQSSLDQCKSDIGWAGVVAGSATGATAAVVANGSASASDQFLKNRGTKTVLSCSVPRNKGITVTIDREMTVDECSMYNAVASADFKFGAGKFGDAYTVMTSMASKANTLAGQGKLSTTAAAQISDAAAKAATCLQGLM